MTRVVLLSTGMLAHDPNAEEACGKTKGFHTYAEAFKKETSQDLLPLRRLVNILDCCKNVCTGNCYTCKEFHAALVHFAAGGGEDDDDLEEGISDNDDDVDWTSILLELGDGNQHAVSAKLADLIWHDETPTVSNRSTCSA